MRIVIAMVALLMSTGLVWAAPVGTGFTYQGELVKSGSPYTGNADGIFRLYNAASGGAQVGSTLTITAIPVSAGLFNVELDFGSVFTGTALWLELQVRTPPDGGYTTLTPRQKLTASPFAIYSLNSPGGATPWSFGPYGIDYTAGHVGLGSPGIQAHAGYQLYVNTGTTGVNPVWIVNNNANYSALYTGNEASGGYGWYDDTSDQHYIAGRVGIGTTTPDPRAKIQTIGGTVGIWSTSTGDASAGGYQAGVYGVGLRGSTDAAGVIGASDYSTGVAGITTYSTGNGVKGQNNTSATEGWLGGPAIGVAGRVQNVAHFGGYFENTAAGGVALRALGLTQVKTLQILGADLAESFPVAGGKAEPGTVLMLRGGGEGELRISDEAYSSKVAGVVSGANGLDAGVVLKGKSFESEGQAAVALSGRVWVQCDATRRTRRSRWGICSPPPTVLATRWWRRIGSVPTARSSARR